MDKSRLIRGLLLAVLLGSVLRLTEEVSYLRRDRKEYLQLIEEEEIREKELDSLVLILVPKYLGLVIEGELYSHSETVYSISSPIVGYRGKEYYLDVSPGETIFLDVFENEWTLFYWTRFTRSRGLGQRYRLAREVD